MYKALIIAVLALFLAACGQQESAEVATADGAAPEQMAEGVKKVEVIQMIPAAGYSYIEGRQDGETMWLAGPPIQAGEGDVLYYTQSMTMTGFESTALERTFDKILFVNAFYTTPPGQQQPMGESPGAAMAAAMDAGPRKSVADIRQNGAAMAGETVTVSGKVVKVNANIMDRNWVHLQDGSAEGEAGDLLITTTETFTVGENATIKGVVVVGKDFGAGYSYDVLLEGGERIP